MGYDPTVEIAFSAPGFINSTAKFARKCLLLVVVGQGLDPGQKSVANSALSLLAQRFKERNTIHCVIRSVHRQNQITCFRPMRISRRYSW